MISVLFYSVSYIIIAILCAIVRPVPFKLFGWSRNDDNEAGWNIGSVFWPILICVLIVMIPARGVASLRDKFEDYLYNHGERKLLKVKEKEAKMLSATKPVENKEAFYRDMNCMQCGHMVSVPR